MHSHRHLPGVDAWGLLHFALEGVGVTDSQGEHIHAGVPLAWVRLDEAEPAAEDRGIIENLAMDVCQDLWKQAEGSTLHIASQDRATGTQSLDMQRDLGVLVQDSQRASEQMNRAACNMPFGPPHPTDQRPASILNPSISTAISFPCLDDSRACQDTW